MTDQGKTDEGKKPVTANAAWHPAQVYIMAGICLVAGVMVGYLVRGSAPAATTPAPQTQPAASANASPHAMPSLDDMKRMADAQVQPLLTKLQADPNNSDLLNQVGSVYRVTHQFKTAETYYQKALAINPKNVGARTDLASCMFYEGDVDGAIAQLEKSLTYDPKHAGTLFNLGMIRWKGKNDAKGAIATWQKLLKLNPDYDNKDTVEKLIAEAQAHPGNAFPSTE